MILLLLPPALFALANIVDKFLVHGDDEDSTPGALTALSGLFNLIAAVLVTCWVLFRGVQLPQNPFDALALMLNGGTFVLGVWLYLRCIFVEEVSKVVPWFQFIPVFGLIGGLIWLGEIPTTLQCGAIFLLVVCGWFLSSSHAFGGIAPQMLLASALLASNDVVFAEFGRKMETSCAIGCDMCGKVLWSSLALLAPSARRGFIVGIRTRFKLQASSEVLTIGADAVLDAAKMIAPIAIVQAVCCAQPAFVLVLALAVAPWRPDVLKETMDGSIAKRAGIIVAMVMAGAYLVYTMER